MNIDEIINAINAHEELNAEVINGLIEIWKIDDKPIGNELIGDYLARIVGREVWSHLCIINLEDCDSRGSFEFSA